MTAPIKSRKKDPCHSGICPIVEAIKTIVTESRLLVVRHLFTGPKGFNELWRESGINSKTLSVTLKFLEQQRIVRREILSTRPFTVQYSLAPSGMELKPALEAFGDWGIKWLPKCQGNRADKQHAAITRMIPNR